MRGDISFETTLYVLRLFQKTGDVQLLAKIIRRDQERFESAPDPQRNEFLAIKQYVKDLERHESVYGAGSALSLDDKTVLKLLANGFPRYTAIASRRQANI